MGPKKAGFAPLVVSDLALINGNVITMADVHESAEAVLISQGEIAGVGTTSAIRRLIKEGTRILDLKGRAVVPGLIDAHNHMLLYGLSRLDVDCRTPPLGSIPDLLNRIRKRAKNRPNGSWIKAFGYGQFALKEKRHPSRWELDGATSKHPVLLRHFSFHACVLNSFALHLCGISSKTRDPQGGRIARDPTTGEPTGLLMERAQSLADRQLPPLGLVQMKKAIRLASKDFVKVGITTVQDPGWVSHDTSDYLRAYGEAEKDGGLQLRVAVMVNGDRLEEFLHSKWSVPGKSNVRIGPVKIFADGVVNLRTAAMTKPYSDRKEESGFLVTDKPKLVERVVNASRAGLQVAVHAIGDRAIDSVLDAFETAQEKVPTRRLRNRLIHAVIVRPDQIQRIKRLGVVIDAQPIFFRALGDQFSLAVGPERGRSTLPFGTFLRNRISICGSSDAPCTDHSPLTGIAQCMARTTASGRVHEAAEKISAKDGLRMYTSLAAYNCLEEGSKGSIEIGKLGDLVVLSGNPLESDAERVARIAVEMTIVGGQVVYRAGGKKR